MSELRRLSVRVLHGDRMTLDERMHCADIIMAAALAEERGTASPSATAGSTGDVQLRECGSCLNWLACQMNARCQHSTEDSPAAFHWESMYREQCETTDEWHAKYEAEREKKADATLLKRIAELEADLATVNQRLIAANAPVSAIGEQWRLGYAGGGMYLPIAADATEFYIAWRDKHGRTWIRNVLPLPEVADDVGQGMNTRFQGD